MAVDADTARLIAAVAIRLGRPLHVVDHKEVEPSVPVVVEPGRRDRPIAAGDPGSRRHVFESSISAVVQQLVLADSGDEQVHVSIVVVICRRRPHGIAHSLDAGGGRHVGEPKFAIIADTTGSSTTVSS